MASKDCPGTYNLHDDIIVVGADDKEHDENLNRTVHKLQESGLTLNYDKCEIGVNKMIFMGDVLTADGLQLSSERIKAIADAPQPQNKSEMRSFLGSVQFCVKFIENFATISSRPHPEPVRTTPLPQGPWQEISVDLLEILGNNHLLVVVDYYSRWIEAILLKKTDAQHVIRSMEAIFRTHGLPEAVRSANGPPFASREFEGFLDYLGIEHKKGVPYWPQSNGQVERCNETVLKII